MITDHELVERSRRRDADAFGALVRRHQQLVFGVALARCHDPALAEDVAQEAFVAAWRDLDELRDADRVGTWVAGIARNLAASAVRTRVRRERFAVDAIESNPDVRTPEDATLEREDRELLQRALAAIPDTHRETLVLFYLQGQSVAEIASALGITADLVKQRLSRGRRALRETVADRVESALTRARLRPAFGAGVLAALSTASPRKAAAGKVIAVMSIKKITVVAAVAIAAGALWLGARREDTSSRSPDRPGPGANTRARRSQSDAVGDDASTRRTERFSDKGARATLLAEIREAQKRRSASAPAAASSSTTAGAAAEQAESGDGDLDSDYIRGAMQELVPLLGDCYSEGLERDAKLAGNVTVDFTIEGEPDIGGLVSESAVDASESTLGDATVRECIQEAMYALKIDPPTQGGIVHVHYPFTFAPRGQEPPPRPPQ